MARSLADEDFPLRAIGVCVYRRTESSPLLTAPDADLAANLALRLNRDDTAYPSPPIVVGAFHPGTERVAISQDQRTQAQVRSIIMVRGPPLGDGATPEQIERAARAVCADHYAKRFGKPETDEHVQMNVEANWRGYVEAVGIALQAARAPVEPDDVPAGSDAPAS